MNTGTWRQRALLGGLAVVVVLAALPNDSAEPILVEPRPARSEASARPATEAARAAATRLELERLKRQAVDEEVGNAFGAMSWYVPPPPPPPRPPVKPPPPPPPAPPPMPFNYLGRYQDGATLIILLTKGDRVYTVSVGSVIENTYRVERLNGGVLELTYLPLNMKQTISAS